MKHAGGRPSKYEERFCDEIIAYFDRSRTKEVEKSYTTKNGTNTVIEVAPEELPLLQDFAHSIGVSHKTMLEWCEKHQEFGKAYARAKELQEGFVIQNAMTGRYNPQFAIFMGKNMFRWTDKSEQDLTLAGQINTVNTINYSDAPDWDAQDPESVPPRQ